MSDTSLLDRDAMLPGLDDLPSPMSVDDLDNLPIFTAAVLHRDRPDVYARAAALFFGAGISLRMTCRICRISPHTMAALIRAEQSSQTAAEWRAVASADLREIMALATGALRDLLANKKAVETAGIKSLATLLDRVVQAHEMLAGRAPGQRPESVGTAADYVASLRLAEASKSVEGGENGGTRGMAESEGGQGEKTTDSQSVVECQKTKGFEGICEKAENKYGLKGRVIEDEKAGGGDAPGRREGPPALKMDSEEGGTA